VGGAPEESENRPPPARLSDADLVARMREGDTGAYDELYRRHAPAVRRYARSCCRDTDTAKDLTNEVFASTLQAVRRGKGPESAVRAYLLTSVRHVAAAWSRTQKREQLVDDFAVFVQSAAAGSSGDNETVDQGADVRAMRQAERTLVVKAFRSLSEKDQMVLWHTTVEEAKPRDVAPLLGLSGNATAVAAHRARENLKKAYLQAHVSRTLTTGDTCARYADRLGAYARGGLRMRAEVGVRRHLENCARCREAAAELANLNQSIRTLVPVALVGWFATAGGAKALGALLTGTGATAAAGSAAAAGGLKTAGSVGAGGGAVGAGGAAGAGGAGGGAASEGMSVPAKVVLATAVAAAAGAAWAFVLAGGDQAPKKPESKPPATHKVPRPPREPAPEPKPTPPKPTPPKATPPRHSKPAPPRSGPSQSAPAPTPPPTHHTPPPEPPAPTGGPTAPPPADYRLDKLRWSVFGDGREELHEPTVRLTGGGWLWRRRGLRIGDREYAYGVTTHSPSSVTIDLHRECRSYDALAGVDELTRGTGAVRFAVYGSGGRKDPSPGGGAGSAVGAGAAGAAGDGSSPGKRLWSSRVVRGGERPVPVHVSLRGVRTLRLVVRPDGADGSWGLADWARSTITCR
jgi:RNA polymerase sigma factor (sigma-70 family)